MKEAARTCCSRMIAVEIEVVLVVILLVVIVVSVVVEGIVSEVRLGLELVLEVELLVAGPKKVVGGVRGRRRGPGRESRRRRLADDGETPKPRPAPRLLHAHGLALFEMHLRPR